MPEIKQSQFEQNTDFDSLGAVMADDEGTAKVVDPKKAQRKAEQRATVEAWKKSMDKALQENPNLVSQINRLSDSLEVEKCLGYGDSGNIRVAGYHTSEDGKKERNLVKTSKIVGYRVRNVGTEPIPYTTEVWTKDENGVYVGSRVQKVMAPGATADLPREFMTMLCTAPEFSFQLKNGRIVRGAGASSKNNIKAELRAHYFTFNRSEGVQVNQDDVKMNVGEIDPATGKWHVLPEFQESFGFLENAPEAKGHTTRKAAGTKFSVTTMGANYLYQMLKGNVEE